MQRGPTAADKAAAEPRPKRVRGPAGSSGSEGAEVEAPAPSIAAISDLPPQPAPKKRRHEKRREQAQQAQQAQQGSAPGASGHTGGSSEGGARQGVVSDSSQRSVEGALADGSAPQPAGKQHKEVQGRSVQPEA